jgi:hypothetical protein
MDTKDVPAEAEIIDDDVPDLISDEEVDSSPRPEVWYLPRIEMRFDLPPWFAAFTLAIVAHVITSTAETCRCR